MLHGFVLFCILLGEMTSLCLVTASSCSGSNLSPCTCSTSDGTLSLQTLMDKRNNVPLSTKDGTFEYYIAPCNKPITNPIPCQKLSSLVGCQVDQLGLAYGLGSPDKYVVTGDPMKGTVAFINEFTGQDRTRRMKLLLKCAHVEENFSFLNQTDQPKPAPLLYTFQLETKYACLNIPSKSSGGLSAGSVMVILFFVAVIVYLVGGTLFLKYVRKAEGRESIPNYEFWSDFPALVKDGVLFTFRGCKAESTYEKI